MRCSVIKVICGGSLGELKIMPGFTGKCLCGAVSYRSSEDPVVAINCHCEDCRRSTGAVFGTNVMVPEAGFELSGEVKSYEHTADSGNAMTKFFCPNCGSLVYGTGTGRPNIISVRAGSIDDTDKVTPSINVFLDSKLPSSPMNEDLTSWPRMPQPAPQKD